MRKLATSSFLLAVLVTAALPLRAATPSEFYLGLLRRGVADVQTGQYKRGSDSLKIAAFGLVESVENYQTAHVYLAVAAERLGDEQAARDAARRVAAAELVERHYLSLPLPRPVRDSFDAIARKVLSAGELATIFEPPPAPVQGEAAAHPAAVTPADSPRPAPAESAATTPTSLPAVVPAAGPANQLERRIAAANDALRESRLGDARTIYRELLADASLPHVALLQIGEGLYRARDFEGSLSALSRAGELQRGEEPYGFYLAVALYESGQYEKAKTELQAARPFISLSPELSGYVQKIEAGAPAR